MTSLWNICVKNDFGYFLLFVTTKKSSSDFLASNNLTGFTCEAGTAFFSGVPLFTLVFFSGFYFGGGVVLALLSLLFSV